MVQWINLNWNNISVLVCQYSYCEKKGPILPPLVGLMAGMQAGREADQQMKFGWILKFLKFYTGLIIQTFILFNIIAMLLQC